MRFEYYINQGSQTLPLCCRITCFIFTTRQLLPALKRTCYLLVIAKMLSSNLCATVIVNTLITRLNACKSILNNTSPNLPPIFSLSKPRQFLSPLQSNNSFLYHLFHESAIGRHPLGNTQCHLCYSNNRFSLFVEGRSTVHLPALETKFIKSLNPNE